MKAHVTSVGNDIVDLCVEGPHLHARYLERAFTALERSRCAASTSLALFWEHWAAKEAAFKALKRIVPSLVFVPRRFEYDCHTRVVSHGNHRFDCVVTASDQYVFVVASLAETTGSQKTQSWIETLGSGSISLCSVPGERKERVHSRVVRSVALDRVARFFKIDPSNVTLGEQLRCSNDGANASVPIVTIADTGRTFPISYTHDGRFVACSVLV